MESRTAWQNKEASLTEELKVCLFLICHTGQQQQDMNQTWFNGYKERMLSVIVKQNENETCSPFQLLYLSLSFPKLNLSDKCKLCTRTEITYCLFFLCTCVKSVRPICVEEGCFTTVVSSRSYIRRLCVNFTDLELAHFLCQNPASVLELFIMCYF